MALSVKIIRSIFRIAILSAVSVVIFCVLAVYLLLPWNEFDQLLEERRRTSGAEHELIELKQIPRQLTVAILVGEDDLFLTHKGFNLRELKTAVTEWVTFKSELRGASTLSQQTARILFLSNRRSFVRKALEFFTTIELERRYSKEDILTLYLSYAQWGEHAYGIKAASRHYFKKKPHELTSGEAAILVALLPNPDGVLSEITSGRISQKTELKLMRLNIWSNAIVKGLESLGINDSLSALWFLRERPLEYFLVESWYKQRLDRESMITLFSEQFQSAVANLNLKTPARLS